MTEKKLTRFAVCVEYDGTHFKGWQTQLNQRTVQSELEAAVSKVANHPVPVVTAGRTDSAVHGTAQIVHFETSATRAIDAWILGINRFLPADIRVHWVHEVDDSFHARFSAISRSYRYIIYNSRVRPGIMRHFASYYYEQLDVEKMKLGASHLIGEHDFSTIRAAGCQAKSPVRTIHSISLSQKDNWIWFDINANAFLQHMVRNIAGLLIEVGSNKRDPSWVKQVLELRDRTQGGVTALPNGLYLTHVEYDPKYNLPDSPSQPIYWSN